MVLSSVRAHAEGMEPPRALHCEFPIGRPLGKPGDVAFQRRVLEDAFALLQEPAGPVLVDFSEEIADAADAPLACALPPRHDPSLPEAIDEAQGLRTAYERNLTATGRTLVGRTVDVDHIPDAIQSFMQVVAGEPWKEVGLPGHPMAVAKDIMAYYEEAAAAMTDHVPAARAIESWMFKETATGKVLLDARQTLTDAGEGFAFYLVPFTQG